ALNVADATNLATIGKNATVSATGLTVTASQSGLGDKDKIDTFSAQATAGASDSGKLGVAGAVAINLITDTTKALIDFSTTVNAAGGDVSLTAAQTGTGTATAKAANTGRGTYGVGAS